MKTENIKRICSLVVAVMMVLPLFGITTAFAEETYRFDDFEDYEEGFTAFATTGYSEPKLASIVVDGGNKCIKIPEGGKLYYDNRTLAEDTDTIITSVNFKIKDTVSEGSVSGFTGALSQWAKVYVRLVGTDLYFSTSMNQAVSANDKIYSGLEVDKWYNVYIVIDRSTMTRSVYICGEKVYSSKYTHGKDGGEQDYRRRMLLSSNKGSIYFDNIEMFELVADEYKLERIRINSIVQSEKNIGYVDGKYPDSAIDMFRDSFSEVTDMDGLNEAFAALESRKIDTSSSDETAAFIEINVPSAINVEKGTEAAVSLGAAVKTVSLNEISTDVAWEIIDSDADGVYVDGSELVVPVDATSGIVKLKACYDELYAYAALKVNVVAPLVFQDFESFEEGYTNFGTEGYKEVRNVTLVEENNNKFISMTKTDLSTAYIVWEDNTLDTNVMVTSVSFMIKDTEADGSVLGFTGALGQYSKGYIRVKGNNLYLRRSVDDSVEEADKIYSDLELNKWYSIYLVIDKNSMTRSIYLGGEKIYSSSYTHGKDGGEQDYRRRWIGGLMMTRLFKPLKLPSVTAYLIAGVLIGPYCLGQLGIHGLGFDSMDAVHALGLVSDVALGFIAFSIGSEFRMEDLKKIGKQAFVIGIFQALVATLFVDLALFAVYKLMPGTLTVPQAITLGAIATATAPAATLMVVRQYKAKGPLTDLLLPIVALDDAVGLIVFAVSFGIAKTLGTGTPDMMSIIVNPIVEIIASLILGAVMGWILTQIEKMFNSNTNRLNMTITFVFLTVALSMIDFHVGPVHVHFSSLLVCMMLGTVFCNICPLSHDLMEKSDKWTSPLLALFFVISGAELELNVFLDWAIVVIGVVYIIFRSLGKYFGTYMSAKATKCTPEICKYLGITLLPQAGVALGMCTLAAAGMPGEGALIRNITLFAVLIYELFGPLFTRMALQAAGDIQPMSEEVKQRRQTKLDEAKNR